MRDKTLPLLLRRVVKANPNCPAQAYRDDNKEIKKISYSEMQEIVMNIAAGLLEIGCKKEDRIGLIADNRKEWLHLSLALSSIGAIDVPRGCDATEQDIIYILSFIISSIISGLISVEVSPKLSSFPSAIFLRIRLTILPERVFGSAETN